LGLRRQPTRFGGFPRSMDAQHGLPVRGDGRSLYLALCRIAQASGLGLGGHAMDMKKEVIQENKARWEVFEWLGSTQTKVIWAVAAAIVVLGIIYLLR
jgi:hypothetical protein